MKHSEKIIMASRKTNYTYSTIESLTGGALAALFTSQDGASEYYVGGMIAYQDSVKAGLNVRTDEPYDSTKMAESLATHTYIDADVIIATTGYIDRSYAFCIHLDACDTISQHVILTEEQLKLPRDQRQSAIARCILREVFIHTGDVRLIAAAGLLTQADHDSLKELLFKTQIKDSVSYTDTVKAISHVDRIIDRIPMLIATMPDLALLFRRAVRMTAGEMSQDEAVMANYCCTHVIEYMLHEFLSMDINDAAETLAAYLDCEDAAFVQITDPSIYYIRTFDDGNSCYRQYNNEWTRTHSNHRGKISLRNVHDSTVCIASISAWKVSEIVGDCLYLPDAL